MANFVLRQRDDSQCAPMCPLLHTELVKHQCSLSCNQACRHIMVSYRYQGSKVFNAGSRNQNTTIIYTTSITLAQSRALGPMHRYTPDPPFRIQTANPEPKLLISSTSSSSSHPCCPTPHAPTIRKKALPSCPQAHLPARPRSDHSQSRPKEGHLHPFRRLQACCQRRR